MVVWTKAHSLFWLFPVAFCISSSFPKTEEHFYVLFIPLQSTMLCLASLQDARNLFLAGRLASFSHVVYGSQRVMKTCSTMGQAVGKRALTVAMEEIILLGHCSIPKLNCTPQPLLHLLFHYFFFVLFFTLPSF
eukprot:m.216054 g.216054  ORF g.216054 m.216054 type:complete len:134 (+) comp16981_c1_seq5:1755-2156(+)